MLKGSEDLGRLVEAIESWHERKLLTIRAFVDSEMPSGLDVPFIDEDGEIHPKHIEGEMLEIFKLGIQCATGYFSELPFQVEEGPLPTEAVH